MDHSHPSHPPQAENLAVLISLVTETVVSATKEATTTMMMMTLPPDR
jgi:hypothetical protein